MSNQAAGVGTQRIKTVSKNLVELMDRSIKEDGVVEVYDKFFIARATDPAEHFHYVFKPAFCVIAQGVKQVIVGDETFRYDPGHYLVSSVDLPVTSYVLEASENKPYMSFRMNLDPAVVASVMMESGIEIKKNASQVKAMNVSPVDAELLDAVVKLAGLFGKPDELKFLAPLVEREIIFRLLKGEQGQRLSYLLSNDGNTHRISKAVKTLSENIDKPLEIENLARELGMSVSGFHHHFKSVTAMSPLQFQKKIRLQEARRLMLGEDLNVANAGFRVGYDDPAYFSRDYKKHFGIPPQRDIAELRRNLDYSN